jgi:hypothetical protein
MVVAEIDATTGQPDLNRGWELDFSRVAGQQAATPDAGAGQRNRASRVSRIMCASDSLCDQPPASTSSPHHTRDRRRRDHGARHGLPDVAGHRIRNPRSRMISRWPLVRMAR